MRASRSAVVVMALSVLAWGGVAVLQADVVHEGEKLDPATYGDSYIESLQAAIDRDRLAPPPVEGKARMGRHGVWVVPTRGASTAAHSGTHYVVNKWGDTDMGIGFPTPVDVRGAFFAGQGGEGVWTSAVRATGYRAGQVVAQTEWFTDIGEKPRWFRHGSPRR